MALALAPLLLVILYPVRITGNEEAYLGLALRFVRPTPYPDYDAYFNIPLYLFPFNTSAGVLLDWIGFERGWVVLRLGQVGLFSVAIGAWFRAVGVAPLHGLLVLSLFMALQRHLFGGEWILEGVESKTIAYSLVLLAFAAATRNRPRGVVSAAIVATYFHFLVGGLWALGVGAFDAALHRDGRRSLRMLVAYALGVAPLVALLAHVRLAGAAAPPPGMPTADYIYSVMTAPFHVAPYEDFVRWAPRIAVFGVLFVWAARHARSRGTALGGALSWLLAGLVAFFALAFVGSWFDRHTGMLGKFYLFRPAALTLLLALSAFFLPGAGSRVDAPVPGRIWTAALSMALIATFVAYHVWRTMDPRNPPEEPYHEAVVAVRTLTEPGDLVIVQPTRTDHLDLYRRIDRPALVHYKLVPTDAAGIYRWHGYMTWRERLFSRGCADGNVHEVPTRYLLVVYPEALPVMRGCGELIWSNGRQSLLRVSP